MNIVTNRAEDLLKFKKGINTLERMVSLTMGPLGKNVIIRRANGKVHVSKDGVTVAKEVRSNDPIEQMGIDLVREVALNTLMEAGDGTTTATVLTNALVENIEKNRDQITDVTEVKKELQQLSEVVIQNVKDKSLDIKNNYEAIEAVATISANNDSVIGRFIADAYKEIGYDGSLIVEESKKPDTYIDVAKGFYMERGYHTQHFLTDESKLKVELEEPYILIYDKKINNIKEIYSVISEVAKVGKPLVIVCEDIEGTALSTLVLNHKKGLLSTATVITPGYGLRRKELLEDLALFSGGEFIDNDYGLSLANTKINQLGRAKKVVIDSNGTTFLGGAGKNKEIQERIDVLKAKLKEEDSAYKREKLTERIASLANGVGIIYAGGKSEVEMKETKDRIDDALHATKAALAEGVVNGGGVTLLNEALAIKETSVAANILKETMMTPFFKIYGDAEFNIHGDNPAINLKTGQRGQGIEIGVIDPTKVVTTTLKNAVSIATMYLTTAGIITQTELMIE